MFHRCSVRKQDLTSKFRLCLAAAAAQAHLVCSKPYCIFVSLKTTPLLPSRPHYSPSRWQLNIRQSWRKESPNSSLLWFTMPYSCTSPRYRCLQLWRFFELHISVVVKPCNRKIKSSTFCFKKSHSQERDPFTTNVAPFSHHEATAPLMKP